MNKLTEVAHDFIIRSMEYKSLRQKTYFNPLSEGFGLLGGAIKGTFQGIARTIVDVNNSVARTIGFKNGNGMSIAGLAVAGGLYLGAPALSGTIAAATGSTQAAVTTTLKTADTGLAIAAGGDLAINTAAKKIAGKNYRG